MDGRTRHAVSKVDKRVSGDVPGTALPRRELGVGDVHRVVARRARARGGNDAIAAEKLDAFDDDAAEDDPRAGTLVRHDQPRVRARHGRRVEACGGRRARSHDFFQRVARHSGGLRGRSLPWAGRGDSVQLRREAEPVRVSAVRVRAAVQPGRVRGGGAARGQEGPSAATEARGVSETRLIPERAQLPLLPEPARPRLARGDPRAGRDRGGAGRPARRRRRRRGRRRVRAQRGRHARDAA